jgi:hypothetical protein
MSDTGKGVGKTTAQMKEIGTFTAAGWAISNGWVASNPSGTPAKIWGICSQVNGGYPFLLAEYSADPCITNSPPSQTAPETTPETSNLVLAATGFDGVFAGFFAFGVALTGAVSIFISKRRIRKFI